MWSCPQCGEEVEDNFEICWACGTSPDGVPDPSFRLERDLSIASKDLNEVGAAKLNDKLVTVATFSSLPPVYGLITLLEANGIPACSENTERGTKVQILESDAERAFEILAEQEVPFQDAGEEEDGGDA
jgi:hypothetical protein